MLLDDQIRSNRRKSIALFAFFFAIYGLLGAAVSFSLAGFELEANLVIFAIFAATAVLVTAFTLLLGDDLAVTLGGGRRIAERRQAPELWDAVEAMALAAGVRMPRIYLADDSSPNAFAAGRSESQALVCVSKGLLERLDKEELEGVMAHEMSHIRNLDVRVMTYAAVLAGSIATISSFVVDMFTEWREPPGCLLGWILAIPAALLAPVAALIVQSSVSRQREFLADAGAADLTRYPQGLASALRQIAASGVAPRRQHATIAHLYIVPPTLFTAKKGGLFATHPPLAERLARLDGLAGGQLHRHNPRVRSPALTELLGSGSATDQAT